METFVKKVDKYFRQRTSSPSEASQSSSEKSRDTNITLEEACVPMPQPVGRCPALPAMCDLMAADAAVTKAAPAVQGLLRPITPNCHNKPVNRKWLATAAAVACAPKTGGVALPCWEDVEEVEKKLEESLNDIKKLQFRHEEELKMIRSEHAVFKQVCVKELASMMNKFKAMHFNSMILAKEVTRQEVVISALEHSENMAQSLHAKQREMANAAVALVNRDRKTKFVTAHTVTYAATAPGEAVNDEVSAAARRQLEQFRHEQQNEIKQLAQKVGDLAAKYHRYNVASVMSNLSTVEEIVPAEFWAMWMFLEEPSAQEMIEFDAYLATQLRPAAIYSPHMSKPVVNWARLNPFQFKNLPQPTMFAVEGCSPDPDFYLKEVENPTSAYHGMVLKWGRKENKFPFGALYGFDTNMGVVAVPTQSLHGYRCGAYSGTWEIDAMGGC